MTTLKGYDVKTSLNSYLEVTKDFVTGASTPRAFLETCLARHETTEPRIKAFVRVNIERARRDADESSRRWRNGSALSSIDGMPVGIKDIFETADMPTEQGSPLFVDYRTGRDAAAVAALREAGAVIVGKTVTTEFAATEPGPTTNPWDAERTPGGSSSGSAAAVGASVIPAALGTQVIGSILRPASYCGCYGYKPTIGSLNRGGSYDYLSQSCSGVLAATLEEAWIVARQISARVGGDPGLNGLSGPLEPPSARKPKSIAFVETAGWSAASDAAKQALQTAISSLKSADVTVISKAQHQALGVVETAIAEAMPLSQKINAWESRWPLNTYARDMTSGGLSGAMKQRLADAEMMTLEEYQELLDRRRSARDAYEQLSQHVDACVTLAAPGAAPIGICSTGNPIFVVPGSFLGVPAVSMPLLSEIGLPLGLQVLGFAHRDAKLFETAAWIRDHLSRTQS